MSKDLNSSNDTRNDILCSIILQLTQWRSKGMGAAKLRLYLKIWKGKSILRGRNFREGQGPGVTKEP